MTTMTLNKELNGIEVGFDAKPIKEILDALKGLGFRWHNKKKVWYAKNTPERLELAQAIAKAGAEKAEEKPVKKAKKVNKFGVKVGDVFFESWGYEQTNIDFWQVVELKGTTQIVLKAINKEVVRDCGFRSCMVRPVKDSFTSHYAGEEIRRTVKGTVKNPYCNAEHGLLYPTTWDTEHNETSYY